MGASLHFFFFDKVLKFSSFIRNPQIKKLTFADENGKDSLVEVIYLRCCGGTILIFLFCIECVCRTLALFVGRK